MMSSMILSSSNRLHEEFMAADPFPGVVIEDFIFPSETLLDAVGNWPKPDDNLWKVHRGRKQDMSNVANLKPALRCVASMFDSPERLQWLSKICEKDLVGDESRFGAGLHQTATGGRLGIHVDFNRLGKLYRCLNVILFVNKDWNPSWDGNLELWSSRTSGPIVEIDPVFNKLVIFETSDRSWHGHPKLLTCPEGVYRKSITWYFYSKERPQHHASDRETTLYAN